MELPNPRLVEELDNIGMSDYLDVLISNGFDTWERVLDITEDNLEALQMKLGHRRKLQRAIATGRGQSPTDPLVHSPHSKNSVINVPPSEADEEGSNGQGESMELVTESGPLSRHPSTNSRVSLTSVTMGMHAADGNQAVRNSGNTSSVLEWMSDEFETPPTQDNWEPQPDPNPRNIGGYVPEPV